MRLDFAFTRRPSRAICTLQSNSDRPLARSSTVAVSEPILRVNSRGADADDASGQPAIGGRSVNLLTAGLRPGVEDPAVAFGLTVMAIDSSYHLQAESDAERDDWIEVASIVTSELLNDSSADSRGGTPSRQVRAAPAPLSFL